MKLFNRPLYRAAGRPVYSYYGGLVQVSLAKYSNREPLDVVSLFGSGCLKLLFGQVKCRLKGISVESKRPELFVNFQ